MSRDEDLLRACLAGAPGAWEAFVRRFSPYLAEACRRALSRCGRPAGSQEVADMLQELFLLLLEDDMRALRSYGGRSSFRAYLAVIASHRALKEGGIPMGRPLSPSFPAPEVEEARDLLARLQVELDRLPPREQLALAMQADGAGLREIGKALRLSENAAAQVLSRAKAGLRERLKVPE